MKHQINKYIKEACGTGLTDGVTIGLAAGVHFRKNGAVSEGSYFGGLTRSDEFGEQIKAETIFDLASLTKPLCTTLCILHLIGQKILGFDDRLGSILPDDMPAKTKGMSIRQLLSHSSGFPAYVPYYKELTPCCRVENKTALRLRILQEPLVYAPDAECRYSDLGFMLLGWIIEQQSGLKLNEYFARYIAGPLGLTNNLFFPALDDSFLIDPSVCAATERCPWRNKVMQGEVHDEHCWLMGGVAGHAGLFGTLRGVMSLCTMFLDIWKNRGPASFPCGGELMREALTTRHTNGTWCLGFDTPTPGRSSSGRYFSPASVGHLGFTGTSFWIDPQQDIVIVLLTNRVHPSRTNQKIRVFRPFFHDYLMEHLVIKG